MKIKIKHVDIQCETEISITCSTHPDEGTAELLRHLQQFVKDEDVFGYVGGEVHRLSLQDVFYIEAVDEKTFCTWNSRCMRVGRNFTNGNAGWKG